MSKQHSTLLTKTATMSNGIFVKFRPFDKVETNWTYVQWLYSPAARKKKDVVTEQCHLRTRSTFNQTMTASAADRPALRSGSAHAKYSVSHHMTIEPFLLLGLAAEYRSRRWVWSTVVRRPSDVCDTHRQTKLTAPKTISPFPEIWLVPTKI